MPRVHVRLLRPVQRVHVEPAGRDEGVAPVQGAALVMGAGGGSGGGAGGPETGRAQVGQGEHGTGAVAPPRGPPLLRPPLPPLSLTVWVLWGALLVPELGRCTVGVVVVAAGPVVGGVPGDGGRS